jgi:CRP-like cAMP-binding protein
MSLIDENPRSATVRALTPVHLMSITRESFLKFISRTPEMKHRFFEDCIKDLVGRLRDLDDDYVVSQYQLWRSAVNLKKKGAA